MAAAIIPIIATLGPVLAQLLPGIIKAVEALFAKPGSGPQKIATATDMAVTAVTQIVNAGGLAGAPPSADELRAMIEATLATMQAGGEAKAPASLGSGTVAAGSGASPFTVEQVWAIRMGGTK